MTRQTDNPENKIVVIVGGSGNLGRQLVRLFKQKGRQIISVARTPNEEADQNLLHNLREGAEIQAAAAEIGRMDGTIEAVIYAAGIFKAQPLGKITEEEIKRNMATHVKAPMLLTSELIERIKKDGTDIVNISSMAAVSPSPGALAYAASKAALKAFSDNLRVALKQYPSRVITLCPAAFDPEDPHQINTRDIAGLIQYALDLPKNTEVSEVVIDLKGGQA